MDARIEAQLTSTRRRLRRRESVAWLATVAIASVVGVALAGVPWAGAVLAAGLACSGLATIVLFVAYIRAAAKEDP